MPTLAAEPQSPHVKVAILGAGFGGLGLAIQLTRRGERDFMIFEKAGRIGGTWRDNTYPGSGCDVPSHLYSYSFEPNPGWTRKFSLQAEILAYLETLVGKYRLAPHLHLNEAVEQARFDEVAGLWRIRTAKGREITADALVGAWGQLNRPAYAAIPGRESFRGVQFHSAEWDHGADLAGKRIAVIGNGASAVQFVPQLQKVAGRLTVFQRSANYIVPRQDGPYSERARAMLKTLPILLGMNRALIYWTLEMRWSAFKQGTKAAQKFTRQALDYMESQVADPELRRKLTPDYPIGCKRVLVSDDYYQALVQPNVSVEDTPIAAIEPEGLRTADGRLHPADVIVWGTGFETTSMLGSAEIVGQGGLSLRQAWAEAPQAYLGITVAGFPNLFLLYGPNTNLGHNSIIYMLERQIDYVLQGLDASRRAGAALSVRQEVMDAFNRRLQEEIKSTAWAGSCSSWYKTADGRITNNWSSSTRAYRRATARFRMEDYAPVPARAEAQVPQREAA